VGVFEVSMAKTEVRARHLLITAIYGKNAAHRERLGFRVARAARTRNIWKSRPMNVNCTNCPALLALGPDGRDIGDTAYKRLCPVLREHFAKVGRYDVGLDCPHMRNVRIAAGGAIVSSPE
jgi:hypothetical protein